MKNIDYHIIRTGITSLSMIVCIMFTYVPARAQSEPGHTVSGIVVDESDRTPLVGVVISVEGSTAAVVTDSRGKFSITVAAGRTLFVSYPGYETQEVTIGQHMTNVSVEMTAITYGIDELIVVGYGTQRKLDLTGAVTSIDAEKATRDRVVMDLSTVLMGRVSGVRVTSTEGTPGSLANVTIRGTTSINADSKPLYIIDGIISDADYISPGDIESISILKDAASTAIYGSRGANGVVLITTKAGKKNSIKVDLYAMSGVQYMAKEIPMMNSRENVQKNYLRNFIYRTAEEGIDDINTVGPNGYDIYQDPEGNFYFVSKTTAYSGEFFRTKPLYYNTNWQREMTQYAPLSDFRVNVSGGSSSNKFSIMLNSQDQQGIMIHTGWKSNSARLNFNQDVKKWLDIATNVSYKRSDTYGNAGERQGGIIYNTLIQSPLYPTDFGMDFVTPDGTPMLNLSNPVSLATLNTREKRNSNLTATGTINIKPMDGLVINLNQTYLTSDEETHIYYPSTVSEGNAANGRARLEKNWSEGWSSENTATYTRLFCDIHRLTAMIGMSAHSTVWESFKVEGNNFEQEDLGYWGFPSANSMQSPSVSHTKRTQLSFFSRLNYILKNRYIFQTTIRYDGSSVFAEGHKWDYFPSASAAWRISEEEWMKNIHFLDNLKLRASWGRSGKQAVGSYESLAKVGTYVTTIDGQTSTMASYFSSLENSALQWEQTEEYNLGLDISLLNGRLGFVFDMYNKTTSELLYQNPIPEYTGYTYATTNMGKIQNRGIEFMVNAIPVKTHVFEWDIDFNIGINRSKVLALGIQDWMTIPTGWRTGDQGYLQVGLPIGNWYGLKVLGLWQSAAEINEAVAQGLVDPSQKPIPGQYKFYDANGDGKTTADDRVIIGSAEPDFTGGFSTTIRWKDFTLSASFVYSYGNEIFNGNSFELSGANSYNNAYQSSVDRWQPTLYYYDAVNGIRGDLFMEGVSSNTIPVSLHGYTPIEIANDTWIEDGSYLRMQDLTLSWNLPQKWVEQVKMRDVRLFLTGTNLFCLTRYSGYDPDVNVSTGMAQYLQPGLDYFSYPRARTFSGGVNITF